MLMILIMFCHNEICNTSDFIRTMQRAQNQGGGSEDDFLLP